VRQPERDKQSGPSQSQDEPKCSSPRAAGFACRSSRGEVVGSGVVRPARVTVLSDRARTCESGQPATCGHNRTTLSPTPISNAGIDMAPAQASPLPGVFQERWCLREPRGRIYSGFGYGYKLPAALRRLARAAYGAVVAARDSGNSACHALEACESRLRTAVQSLPHHAAAPATLRRLARVTLGNEDSSFSVRWQALPRGGGL
jgi:hypothetical protein